MSVGPAGEGIGGIKFEDPKVCKSFLYSCCPHEILQSTVRQANVNADVYLSMLYFLQRMDLGECPKIHEYALRADYELAARKKDYFYDVDVSLSVNEVIRGT